MKQGFRGFLCGVGITLALAVSAAYALDPEFDIPENQLSHDFIHEVNKLVNNYCEVYVGYGRLNRGRRCFRGEVMTGYEGDYIYCADISVDCFSKRKAHPADSQEH